MSFKTTKCYVVMATQDSPVCFVIPSPYAVFTGDGAKKRADLYAKSKNEKASRNHYYVRPAFQEPIEPPK